jgi:hypothetical protein
MKTVPSGRVDCFMNGALAVGGTLAAMNTPGRRGTLVLIAELPLVDGPVIAGTLLVCEREVVAVGCVDDVGGALLEVVWVVVGGLEELDEEVVGAAEEVGGCEVVVGGGCEVVGGSELVGGCEVFAGGCEVFAGGCEEEVGASELVGALLFAGSVVEDWPSVAVLGSAADTGMASRPTPAARERRGNGRENLMARIS